MSNDLGVAFTVKTERRAKQKVSRARGGLGTAPIVIDGLLLTGWRWFPTSEFAWLASAPDKEGRSVSGTGESAEQQAPWSGLEREWTR